jgi:hypothetical protein
MAALDHKIDRRLLPGAEGIETEYGFQDVVL